MKKVIVLILVLGLCGAAQATLVSQWKLEGDTIDSIGTNHGSNHSVSYIAGAPNGADPGGQAGYFGGAAWVNVGNQSSLQPATAISITAWIKLEKELADVWQAIYRRDGTGTTRELLQVGTYKTDEGLWFGIGTTDGYAEPVGTVTDAEMRDGYWHLAAATYDSSVSGQDNIFIYWDGEVRGSMEWSGLMDTDNLRDAMIGANTATGGEPFYGGIDDVRLYNHALSAAEVQALVPEPATIMLLGLGGLGLLRRKSR
jgi:hypothetical protein